MRKYTRARTIRYGKTTFGGYLTICKKLPYPNNNIGVIILALGLYVAKNALTI